MQPINFSSIALQPAGTKTAPAPAPAPAAPAVSPPAAVRESAPAPTEAELKQSIKTANAALKEISSNLEFAHDDSTGMTLVRVYDTTTKEVIRQFPTEEMVTIARAIDNFRGLLIQQKA